MNLRGLQKKKEVIEERQNISGKTILLTGRIPRYTRTTIEKRITELGGYISDKATSYVDITVYTRQDTTKFASAKRIASDYKPNMIFVNGSDFVKNYLKMES